MEFDFEGILAGKDEHSLTELIAEADRDNALARLVIARNDQIKAMAQLRLIGMQLQGAEVE
ncbi:hypothetical protein M3A49_02345 [Paraburkholderia sp. CNPSo 3076]|uniref:hypothetical protein n=1 Tax=Paraburkholderia sp. CNPSo 3076 TaxID=2940936 RepID=UPI002252B3AC|nr:hypothetical protein [Paraburkholderia sp. CNPSo 3076]MCX5538349.1 hypothetical protein [Paraburkholderia sp. CNPSo 3076]